MRTFHAPGRVNLIGEHIDYMGGTVLPIAIDIGTDVSLRPRPDRVVRAFSRNFPSAGVVEIDLDALNGSESRGWANYLAAVMAELSARGFQLPHGFDVEVLGNIPNGAGLSSSASIELAFAIGLDLVCAFGVSPKALALLCQDAENEFIGVACGIMDQMSVAVGRRGFAMAIDCSTLDIEYVPFPADIDIVVANTNQRRDLSASAYNDRRAACERAQELLGDQPLVSIGAAALGELMRKLDPVTARRARHVATEQKRVEACIEALKSDDLARVGELMRQSHESLRDDFDVTGPALDALAEAAWMAPGVIGARMTGAGFGGCTVNLVQPDAVGEFTAAVGRQYTGRTGLTADFHVVRSDDGAREVSHG